MDRYAVIALPDALTVGLAVPLLFFDKIVVPDRRYVEDAFREIEQPEVFSSEWDPDGHMTVAEVRLGVGYHLWPVGKEAPSNWMEQPKDLLRDIEYIEQRGLAKSVTDQTLQYSHSRGSFKSALKILDEQRIRIALQTATEDFVDVCTIRAQPDRTSLTSLPTAINRELVVQYILKQVPTPARDVPIDEVLDFRNDQKVQADLSRLRSWMTKATKEYDSLTNLEDEYRDLYHDYKKSVSHLSRNYASTTLGLIATVAVEFADNLGQLKMGSAVKALIDWRSAIIKKEDKLQSAPGRELAYLKNIEDAFA